MRLRVHSAGILLAAIMGVHSAHGAGARSGCAKNPLNLDLKINYTERLMGRDQHLSVRTARNGAMTVKNVVTGDTVEVTPASCAAWQKEAGERLRIALSHVRRAPAAQEKNLVCDRVAVVSGGGKSKKASICLSVLQATVRGRAFRDLYESIESLLVLP